MNGLHKYSIFLIWSIWASILSAGSLEIRLTTSKSVTIPWISIPVEATVSNTSPAAVEIPKVGIEGIGFGSLCLNIVSKANGAPVRSDEYFQLIAMDDHAPGPWHLSTEILQPGEKRHFSFPYGYAMVPLTLEFVVECYFPVEIGGYRKHNLILDHPILSGKFTSNTLTVKIKEPEGVDRQAFEEFWSTREKRSKTEDFRTKEFWGLISKFPGSMLADQVLCTVHHSSVSADEFRPIKD